MIYKISFKTVLYTKPSWYYPSKESQTVEKNDLIIFLSSINADWIKVLHKGIVGYVYEQRRHLTLVTSADTLDP